MVLAKDEILTVLKSKKIKISPFNKNQIGAGSIDLTLSDEFRKFTEKTETITIAENIDYRKYTKKFRAKEVVLQPNEMVLGMTKEKICMPPDLAGFLQGRTRFARVGLAVHITASFVQPGSSNRQVLEIRNLGPKPLRLKAGTKIVQLILEPAQGKAEFKGKYNNQVL